MQKNVLQGRGAVYHQKLATLIWITFNDSAFYLLKIIMIVRPQQHWIRLIFVWHGSVLSKIFSRLLLNFLLSIAVIIMLPRYTMLGIKFTLAPFSILGVAIAIFLGFRNNACYARYVEARHLWGQLMIASRSILREVKTTLPDERGIEDFVRLQIAFAHCLRMTLRRQPQTQVLGNYLDQRRYRKLSLPIPPLTVSYC